MKKVNIFIFGDRGFIGSHLKNFLFKQKEFNLININFKAKGKLKTIDYYKRFWLEVVKKTNIIIYLNFNNDLENLKENISDSFLQNITPLHILCDVIKKNKKKVKLIYTSTASLYANKIKLPANENSRIELNNIYEFLKYSSEQILIHSSNNYLNYQIIRLSNVYGENISDLKQKNRQVLTKVITDACLNGKINIYGSGNYFRDFIHVNDVCEAIYRICITKKLNNEIFNIASGKKIKLINIFKNIRKIINTRYNKIIKLEKIKILNNFNKSDFRNFQASINKSKTKLLWKPKINFNVGLNHLIKYVFENKN